jgi:predicted  nucleic acid-binding Zn-ribbon protein
LINYSSKRITKIIFIKRVIQVIFMPYKCLTCSDIYDDLALEVQNGCKCGSRLFFYMTQDKIDKITKKDKVKEESEKQEIKKVAEKMPSLNKKSGIIIDFEAIKLLKRGKYKVNVDKLFSQNEPRIYKLEEGKYIVDFDSLFNA